MENKNVYWSLLHNRQWNMYIAATTEGLCYIGSQNAPLEELAAWIRKHFPSYSLVENKDVLQPYALELIRYMEGCCTEFTLPLDLRGTPFQQTVWKALQQIPYGHTVSYTHIAESIQKPKSVRAVGSAIGANPLLIVVPCHRVIAKNGKLAGYRGGLHMKEQLLGLEK